MEEFTVENGVLTAYRGNGGKAMIPDGVTAIGEGVFKGCDCLREVVFPSTLLSVGEGAFRGCTALSSLTLPDSVQELGRAAFMCCESLHTLKLSARLTAITESVFMDCISLQEVTFPDGLKSIGWVSFEGCYSLKRLVIPDTVNSIGSDAFDRCWSLEELTLGKGLTSIGAHAFGDCSSLSAVHTSDEIFALLWDSMGDEVQWQWCYERLKRGYVPYRCMQEACRQAFDALAKRLIHDGSALGMKTLLALKPRLSAEEFDRLIERSLRVPPVRTVLIECKYRCRSAQDPDGLLDEGGE